MSGSLSVIGLGNWGTALANHLALKGIKVIGWCLEPDVEKSINSRHINPKYQSDVMLHPNLSATCDLVEATSNIDLIVLAFPSRYLSVMLPKISPSHGTCIVSIIKGLVSETLETPIESIARHFEKSVEVGCISGPSFARDVIRQMPCGVVAAARTEAVAKKIANLFSNDKMRVYVSTDPIGVELGGIVKNVIALAAGICDGLQLGESARAGLITRGLAEMVRLAVSMGASPKTLHGLSGLGDLVMTATSDTSRNRTVGVRLGRGESLETITATLGSVAESVTTTPLVIKLAKRNSIEMPISEGVSKILLNQATPEEIVRGLLARPVGIE